MTSFILVKLPISVEAMYNGYYYYAVHHINFHIIIQVEVVDPMSLSEEFVNILSTSVVAVRVNARIILHSKL